MSVEHVEGESVDGSLELVGSLRPLADQVDVVDVDNAVPAVDQRQAAVLQVWSVAADQGG